MTTYTYLEPKYSNEIQDKIVSWLNDNLDDPYEQATKEARSDFVYSGDYKKRALLALPSINVTMDDFNANKISQQSKTAYLQEEEHHLMIYYVNQKVQRYTFGNGQTLIGEAQCRRYLQYIMKLLKANATDFDDYCHKITFGTIPKPTYGPEGNTWISVLPVTVFTYRK